MITTPAITTVPANKRETSVEATEKEDTNVLGLHRGAIDQTTITTQPPCEVMKQVTAILYDMGLEMQKESAFKYRCVRAKKGSDTLGASHNLELPLLDRASSPDFSPVAPTFQPPYIATKEGPSNLYGSPSDDSMDEVRFSVELTKLVGLKDTYSLDIRRLKGSLKSYSFIYNTIRRRAELNH